MAIKTLIVCEGETDWLTLVYHGYAALGLPGATNVKCLKPEHVAGFDTILVVSEPDVAGQKFPTLVADHLREGGYPGRVVPLAMGPTGYKDPAALHCADPLTFKEKFDALIAEALKSQNDTPITVAGPYEITKAGTTIFRKSIKAGHSDIVVEVELANFHARIVEDVLRDDGVSHERILTIEAVVDHKPAQRLDIPASQFGKLDWTAKLRGGAVIVAGQGARDRLREAIERLSGRAQERTIYTHTGWREIDGEWVYLHGGGGIGADGSRPHIQAELPPSLAEFRLPDPPDAAELREALKTSAEMLEVGDRAITLPLFAAIWRAAIGEVDFSIFLVGQTGSYKSSFAAVAQRHFGAGFDRERLPASWASTANYLENLAFRCKDAVLVIDDFRPATHGFDRELQKEAERIFRAQGNRSGRGRMNADGSERPTRVPRGMILTTAEEFVWGASLESRQVVLEVAAGGLDLNRIIALHQAGATGLLAAAMAGWVQWLASRLTGVRKRLRERAAEIARNFIGSHPRVALALGELQATLEIWQEFSGISVQGTAETLTAKAEAQAVEAENYQDPAHRFADLLMSALISGKGHVMTVYKVRPSTEGAALGWHLDKMGSYVCQGPTTLWVDEMTGDWLLDINTAYSIVMGLSNDGNRPNVGVRMLTRALAEGGYVLRTERRDDRQTYKVRKLIDGARLYLLAIDPEKFGLPTITVH